MQKKSNTPAYQNRCVLRLILYHVCVNLPVMIFSYPAFRFMGLRSSLPLPHWYALTLLSWLKHLTYFSYLIASILHLTISACKYESTNVRVGEERLRYFNLLFLQDGCCISSSFLLCPWGFYILLGAQGTAYEMAIQTCSQRPPRVSDIASLHLTLHVATFSSLWQNKSLQVCHTLWFNFWICPPSWNFVPGIRHSCWSCSYWPSSVHLVAVDGVEGIGDSWSSQRLSLPMEPIKFPATVWRVSKLDHCFPFPLLKGTVFVYLKLNVLPCAQLLSWWIARTSMTTITVCYTPSQGTMPRHLFTWTGEDP